MAEEFNAKLLVIGDMGVGKTSLVNRYVLGSYRFDYRGTVGVQLARRSVRIDNTLVTLEFWDLSGQDRFRSLCRVYYRRGAAALVVCDVSQRETLESAAEWRKVLDREVVMSDGKPMPAVLIVNKTDLGEPFPDVDLKAFCEANGFLAWFATSAKDDTNVTSAMTYMAKLCIQRTRSGIVVAGDPPGGVDVAKKVTTPPRPPCC